MGLIIAVTMAASLGMSPPDLNATKCHGPRNWDD